MAVKGPPPDCHVGPLMAAWQVVMMGGREAGFPTWLASASFGLRSTARCCATSCSAGSILNRGWC